MYKTVYRDSQVFLCYLISVFVSRVYDEAHLSSSLGILRTNLCVNFKPFISSLLCGFANVTKGKEQEQTLRRTNNSS